MSKISQSKKHFPFEMHFHRNIYRNIHSWANIMSNFRFPWEPKVNSKSSTWIKFQKKVNESSPTPPFRAFSYFVFEYHVSDEFFTDSSIYPWNPFCWKRIGMEMKKKAIDEPLMFENEPQRACLNKAMFIPLFFFIRIVNK